jgi:hypothetical protein
MKVGDLIRTKSRTARYSHLVGVVVEKVEGTVSVVFASDEITGVQKLWDESLFEVVSEKR